MMDWSPEGRAPVRYSIGRYWPLAPSLDQTDHRFRRQNQRLRLVLFYCLLLAPWIGIGVVGALQPAVNSPLDWVDSDFLPRRDYDQFCARFGAGDTVVISWPGCTISDPAVDTFVHSLRASRGFQDNGQWLFRRVLSGREAFLSMTSPPIGVSADEALQRLGGTLIGPDRQTTCVIVCFNEQGLQQRSRLVPLIRAAAVQFGKADADSLHLAGPIMDGYAVDRSSQRSMQRFAPLSSIIAFCVCLLCLEGFFPALLVFALACVSQAVALAIIHHSGGTMTALLIVIPPLVQVLAISSGVHFVNYYRSARQRHDPARASRVAMQMGAVPCALSATTTAIGLASLTVSGLSVVGQFGTYAAIGVIANAVLLLGVLPGLLSFLDRGSPLPVRTADHGGFDRSGPRRGAGAGLWHWLVALQQRCGGGIALVAVAAMLFLGFGVLHLEASVRIETLFSKGNRLLRDYEWLESHVGPLVPIETMVHFPRDCPLDELERLRIVQSAESCLQTMPAVASTTSSLQFLPIGLDSLDATLATLVMREATPWLQRAEYLSQDETGEYWRLTAHVSAVEPVHYGDLLANLHRELINDPVLQSHQSDIRVDVSGLMPLVHGIQSRLLLDLFMSFVTAFLLIALVMTVAQAGIVAGLLSMIPNVFPTVTLFGLLGWLGWSIDIGSIMTASVAMGIAVDDTLHFLSVFQRELDRGSSREDAVRVAYAECGKAMIQTTLICGSGLAIFALSDFVPTSRFAWMMVSLLMAALIGDLIVLPALLLSPLGKFFQVHQRVSSPSIARQSQASDGRRIDDGHLQPAPVLVRPRRNSSFTGQPIDGNL